MKKASSSVKSHIDQMMARIKKAEEIQRKQDEAQEVSATKRKSKVLAEQIKAAALTVKNLFKISCPDLIKGTILVECPQSTSLGGKDGFDFEEP